MFERFTDRARRVLLEAQLESAEHRHGFLGTEHVLLGIMRLGEGLGHDVLVEHGVRVDPLRQKVTARLAEWVDDRTNLPAKDALAAIGIDLDSVRTSLEAAFGAGALPDPYATPAFTPKAKESLERGYRRALTLRQRYVGTEHELLGLLELRDGVACHALLDLGVDLDALDADVVARAAPEQQRVTAAWKAMTDLRERVRQLDDEQQVQAQTAIERLIHRATRAISSEQSEVNRLAAITAAEIENALEETRSTLAGFGLNL